MPDPDTASDSVAASPYKSRAFPSTAINAQYGGMSQREWFAGQALSGLLASQSATAWASWQGVPADYALAKVAFGYADAMIGQSHDAPTVPRLYSDEDTARAADAIRRNARPNRPIEEIVDRVAEALGMRKAGA